jgi:putative oxidoreductase
MTITRTIARPMIAATFLVGAADALKNAPQLAGKASGVIETLVPLVKRVAPSAPIPEDPVAVVRMNAAIQLVAAGALATGKAPRLAAATLAASLVPTTFAGHKFWEEKDPDQRKAQLLHFLKNTSTLGGLILASVDTEGKPGVAWRAKRAAKDVRREARRATRAAKQEARLAAAKLG